jgi:hypothetical protein
VVAASFSKYEVFFPPVFSDHSLRSGSGDFGGKPRLQHCTEDIQFQTAFSSSSPCSPSLEYGAIKQAFEFAIGEDFNNAGL